MTVKKIIKKIQRLTRLLFCLISDLFYVVFYYFSNVVCIKTKSKIKKTESRNEFVFSLPTEIVSRFIVNEMQILGDEFYCFGKNKIHWNVCPKSQYKWSNRWHKFVNKERPINSDIKTPWELGRLQYMLPLLMHSISNQDEKLNNKISSVLDDFIRSNPPGFGVQWACTMDVSIRAINIICILELLDRHETGKYLNRRSIELYLKAHLRHICKYNEWNDGDRNNHYLTNVLGGLATATYLYKKKGAHKYKEIIESLYAKLLVEVEYQFDSEGMNFEGSINYHRLSTEIISLGYLFGKSTGVIQVDDLNYLRIKLSRSIYVLDVLTENGRHPKIGDTDSGMILNITPKFHFKNNVICQDYSKLSLFLFNIDFLNFNNTYDLLHSAMLNNVTVKPYRPIRIKRIKNEFPLILPTESEELNISLLNEMFGLIKIDFHNGWVLIKLPGELNTGHSHYDYLKVEVKFNGIYNSIFKGTDKYSKSLNHRNFDRVNYYQDVNVSLLKDMKHFSSLPECLMKKQDVYISKCKLKITVGNEYICVFIKERNVYFDSNVMPFMYPKVLHDSYNSKIDLEYI